MSPFCFRSCGVLIVPTRLIVPARSAGEEPGVIAKAMSYQLCHKVSLRRRLTGILFFFRRLAHERPVVS